MTAFNWFDYIIIGILFFSVLVGLMRGLVKELFSLLTLIAAFLIAGMFAGRLASYFTNTQTVQAALSNATTSMGVSAAQPISYLAIGISFILIFVVILILGAILGSLLSSAVSLGGLGFINRVFGGVFGVARGIILVVVMLFLFELSPLVNQSWWQQSQLVSTFQPAVQWLDNLVQPGLQTLKSKMGDTFKDIDTNYFQGGSQVLQPISK